MSTNVKKKPYFNMKNTDESLVEALSRNKEDDNFHRASYLYEKKHNGHQQQKKLSLLLKPMLNMAVSTLLTIAILLVFIKADGTSLDYTLVGMKLPTLVSLLLNIYVIFVGSGIAMFVFWGKLK